MADFDNIFKALRLVPEFDGNPNVLTRFIRLCDQLAVQFIGEQPNELNQLALINGILNKVTGNAARLINANGVPQDWIGIRNALINNFADQRDETALYNDLALLTQGQNSPQEFYERCQNLFATIMTYVSLHESIQTTMDAKRDLYKKLTLQAFLRGLKDPLGSRIRCMRPETIEKALEFVHEECNTMYMQNRNDYLDRKPAAAQVALNIKPQTQPLFSLPNQHFTMPPKPFNMPGPSRPFVIPQQPTWKSHFNQPRPAGPSRTQQMFRAAPPNYNAQENAFKMAPRPVPSARPMSGVSHFTPRYLPPTPFANAHDWRRSGNPPPSNYFKTREMNMNYCMDYDPYYDSPDAYQGYEIHDVVYDHGQEFPNDYQSYPYVYEPPVVEEAPAHPDSIQDPQDFQQTPISQKPK